VGSEAGRETHKNGARSPEPPADDKPIAEKLAHWQEGHCGPGGSPLESCAINDPSLLAELRKRKAERDQPPRAGCGPGDPRAGVGTLGPAASATAGVTEEFRAGENDAGGARPSAVITAPDFLGRYRVNRLIGQGGFGQVFLAHDTVLDRDVAVKLPVVATHSDSLDVDTYLREARLVARLSHPNIVPVYDVGRSSDGRWYVVSKYMEGGDLAVFLERGRPSFLTTADMVRMVCEALHYTHTQDLFHRDIKPANILLDGAGTPYLADFGLALKDEDVRRGAGVAGTAAYMSPEQARGEGHLVDGRSDIFSLGIVLYEMLTGRRPFRGESRSAVLHQVQEIEPRPPRQIDDRIPRELERICAKAISKRSSERYATARDVAEDLRHFMRAAAPGAPLELREGAAPSQPPCSASPSALHGVGHSDLGSQTVRIVPKGLGSFDENDADFFLELLPGPRDRDGLPDGLRFWKTRIEATDLERTFRVGMMYGPSGCGKSSLVKAGLLPRVGGHVRSIYVEATAGETEARLLRGVRKLFPKLPEDSGLVESALALRRGHGLQSGCKVLLVLDQFEQWLFATQSAPGSELIAALRQCDGEHVQALCLLRDDFWMAATRFMKELEIELVPGSNVAAVDLFDPKHARKVLAAYGRAYESLPLRDRELSREHKAFLDQAVAGLSQDGRVVPVRLACFAEMIKGKPWEPATLREVGGMDGVGVRFLDDTFCSARSKPNHRYHQKAAQAVLKSLLPETDTDIKGQMRSLDDLRHISGYRDRPGDFGELTRILDNDLRLITPSDPEGLDEEEARSHPAEKRYYQLTHDYLVHSLREWLSRKQRETRRGRAELRLAALTPLWHARPGPRRLPSPLEWVDILCYTRSRAWSDAERRMMRAANWHYALAGIVALGVLGAVLVASLAYRDRMRGEGLVSKLLVADAGEVPAILSEIDADRHWTRRQLEQAARDVERPAKERLHASLALLPVSARYDDYLVDRLLEAGPDELIVIAQRLETRSATFLDRLWRVAGDWATEPKRAFRAACALGTLDPESSRWKNLASDVSGALLLDENAFHLERWLDTLRSVRRHLLAPAAAIFRDRTLSADERFKATIILVQLAPEDPHFLVGLVKDADLRQFRVLLTLLKPQRSQVVELLARELDQVVSGTASEAEKNERASQRANCAVTLLLLREPASVWPLLRHSDEPLARGFLLDRIQSRDVEPGMLAERLRAESDTSARRALILALADYAGNGMPGSERAALERDMLEMFQADPDPGVHSAAEFLLRKYSRGDQVDTLARRIQGRGPKTGRLWYVNPLGYTMVVMDPRGQDPALSCGKPLPRAFALASKEVTVEEFLRFRKDLDYAKAYSPTQDCPANCVTWYDAAAYCRWMSEQEGVPEDQMCFPPMDQIKEGMRLPRDYLRRTGYRLPTEAEAEYACRAGALSSRFFGSADELLGAYAHYRGNSRNRSWPVGALRPNDLGLFDILGNVLEWCQERRYTMVRSEDSEDTDAVSNRIERVVHSGSYDKIIDDVRSDRSEHALPAAQFNSIGMRLARTVASSRQ
jgi:serine/threonine protein kinase